jgi:hypothetical protein
MVAGGANYYLGRYRHGYGLCPELRELGLPVDAHSITLE